MTIVEKKPISIQQYILALYELNLNLQSFKKRRLNARNQKISSGLSQRKMLCQNTELRPVL